MDDDVNMSKDIAEKRKKNREAQTKYRHRRKVRELLLTDKIERLPPHIEKLQQLRAEIKDHLRSKKQFGTLNIKRFKQLPVWEDYRRGPGFFGGYWRVQKKGVTMLCFP